MQLQRVTQGEIWVRHLLLVVLIRTTFFYAHKSCTGTPKGVNSLKKLDLIDRFNALVYFFLYRIDI